MFEKATRMNLRFESKKGLLSVEDLWALPLSVLDEIAIDLHKQLKSGDDISFVNKNKKSNEAVQLKFDIVKHIIDKLLEEAAENRKSLERTVQKQQLLELINRKENDNLSNLSIEELRKKISELD